MKRRILSVLMATAVTASLLVGCGSAETASTTPAATTDDSTETKAEETATPAGEPIKIGVSGPTTGSSAESGVHVNTGIQMAIDEFNAAGGIVIDGVARPVEAVFYDTGSDAQTGLSNCEKLVTADKVDFLWCESFNSAVGIATMELAKKYDIPMATLEPVSSAITDKIVEDPDSYANFFKFGWSSSAYGDLCAETVLSLVESGDLSLPNKTIAICGDETDYARSNVAAIVTNLEKEGYTVVSENYWEFGATDLYAVISDIKSSGADIMFSCSTTPATGVALIRQLAENGLSKFPHMAIYYPMTPEFNEQIGSAADGLLWAPVTVDTDGDQAVIDFAEALKKYNGDELTFDHVDGYSCMYVVLSAMSEAGSLDAAAISEKLLSDSGFVTPKGRIVFDKTKHEILVGDDYVAVDAAQIQGDKSFIIYPAVKANGAYIPIQ